MSALAEAADGDQRKHLCSQPDLPASEMWGERAQGLVAWVKARNPPVAGVNAIHRYATERHWEKPTLEGVLTYCLEQKLLTRYQSVNGPAYKIPLTRVFDMADDDAPLATGDMSAAPTAEGAVRAPGSACLCARTAPSANYGCPEHGGARINKPTKETKTMAKDEVGTKDAAELLGITTVSVNALAREGKVKARQDGRFWFFDRASLIAYRDKRKDGASATDTPPPAGAEGDRRQGGAQAGRRGAELGRRRRPDRGCARAPAQRRARVDDHRSDARSPSRARGLT